MLCRWWTIRISQNNPHRWRDAQTWRRSARSRRRSKLRRRRRWRRKSFETTFIATRYALLLVRASILYYKLNSDMILRRPFIAKFWIQVSPFLQLRHKLCLALSQDNRSVGPILPHFVVGDLISKSFVVGEPRSEDLLFLFSQLCQGCPSFCGDAFIQCGLKGIAAIIIHNRELQLFRCFNQSFR